MASVRNEPTKEQTKHGSETSKTQMSEAVFRVVTEFDVVRVRISKEGEKRAADLQAAGKCLGCEEKLVVGERVTCGLCSTCYHGVLHNIKKRRVTRKDLIRDGEMLPPGPAGRKPKNKFTKKLSSR